MREYCDRPENVSREVYLLISVNRDVDIRRFNDATTTDVAVIFSAVDGEPPFERNMVAFPRNNFGNNQNVRHVSVLDSSLDPLAYPLLFPNGDVGWHTEMFQRLNHHSNAARPRNKVTMLQYASYRLAIRNEFSLLHHSQKLFLQWIVDIYVRIEGTRLHFLRSNQDNIRSEFYDNITDFIAQPGNEDVPIGRRVILPSSFVGSPRNMHQNYLDAMCIVQKFGKPSLFITMTCNPNWAEIINNIDLNERVNFRPELIVRVFKSKLKELMRLVCTKSIFGRVLAIIYTIEFQKRGLPHAHILITLHEDDKFITAADIDSAVSAELPDRLTHPQLYECVVQHMIHGPCGSFNPNSPCMRDRKCTKEFPKEFSDETHVSVNGYPKYKRPDNGRSANVRGQSLDNRYVVPYNPYLLAKFNCHINVEVCTTVNTYINTFIKAMIAPQWKWAQLAMILIKMILIKMIIKGL